MDKSEGINLTERDSSERLPSLIEHIAANKVAGFDNIKGKNELNYQPAAMCSHCLSPLSMVSQ